MEPELPLKGGERKLLRYALSGGMAGIMVDLVYYPMETIKTRIMGSSIKENLIEQAQSISKFRGFSCQMLVSFPYSYIFFLVYGHIRKRLNPSSTADFIAGALAETASNIVRNPLELIKQRLMVGRQSSIIASFKNIYSSRGIRGFYTGYAPTLLRDVLFSATQMPLFQMWKQPFSQLVKRNKNDALSYAVAGSLSGAIAGFLTCPLDVAKTRHMTAKEIDNPRSFLSIMNEVYNENGIQAFFRGVHYRCLILAFGGALYFYAFGWFKHFFKVSEL